MENSEPETRGPPRTLLLKRRIFVMVGLLSLVLIALGAYCSVRLAERMRVRAAPMRGPCGAHA